MPDNNGLKTNLQKALPKLRQASGLALISMVTLVTVHSLVAQGVATVPQTLLAFLAGIFGDVVAGPAIDYLLNGKEDSEFENRIQQFEEQFQQEDVREAIAQLLSKQDAWMGAVGVALRHHENQTVERILRAVAGYQDFAVAEIVKKLTDEFKEGVARLDPEIQYLTDLITNLQAHGEVWQRYIRLPVEAEESSINTRTSITESWQISSVFSVLEESVSTAQQRKRTKLSGGIQEATSRYRRFVLLGEPGAGKTTTIRRLALEQAIKRLSDPNNFPLPMLLYLPLWGENENISQFVHRHWRIVTDPIGLLARGEMHLYLDGLNEMGAQGSQKAKELRSWLETDNSPKYIVVTCREANYTSDIKLGIPEVTIEEMDENLVRELAQHYLQNDAERFLVKILPEWKEELRERQLFRLASNPFRLTALIVVFGASPDGDLPGNNGALMRKLTQALWSWERQKQMPGWIPLEGMEQKFAKLAFDMINEDKPIDVSMAYALARVDDERLVRIGRDANLVEIHNDELRFYHQLLQEYFAAIWIRNLGIDGQVPPYNRYIGGRIPSKFDQVLIALCGIANDPDAIVSYIATQDVYLATACLGSGIKVSEKTRLKVIEESMTHSDEWIRCNAIKVLREIADPLTIPFLINALSDAGRDLRPGGDYVMQEAEESLEKFGQESIPYLIQALNNPNGWIRGRTVRLLGKLHVKGVSSKIIALLSDRENIQFGVPQFVCDVAVDALGQIGDEDTVSLLINMLNEPNPLIRWNVVRTLGQISDPKATSGLIERLSDTSTPYLETYYQGLYGSLYICDSAANALENIGTPEALEAVKRWRETKQSDHHG